MEEKKIVKGLIAGVLILLFSIFLARVLNFGVGWKRMVIPLCLNAIILGWAIGKGNDTSEKASDSLLRGLEISISVYLVMFSWLVAVNSFEGSHDLAFVYFCTSIAFGTMINLATNEIAGWIK